MERNIKADTWSSLQAKNLGFFLGILSDLLGLSIFPPLTGTLSSRFNEGNCVYNNVVFSQVASSSDNCCHLTKLSSTNLSPCLIQRLSRIFSSMIETAPSSEIGGNSNVTCGGSPIYFFKRET